MYKAKEVEEAAIGYFKGDTLAAKVWKDKYALKKGDYYYELTPDDMYHRIAKEILRIENKYKNPLQYDEIYNLLSKQVIIPGGSILYGVGNDYSFSSLGNCFVIGNNADSYGGICQTDQEQVQLMKRRAGVGHDLSHLRPKGAPTTNSAKTSSGIVPFMERYSNSTREVAQDGRRGALMLSVNINHPESLNFITAKDDLTKITGANISVKIDDNFMSVIDKNRSNIHYDDHLIEDFVSKRRNIWSTLVHQAWKTAEPGLLFWDKIKSESIPRLYGSEWEETSTNPCGEIPLCPYDSCRLLSYNLTTCVENPFTKEASINWEKLKRHAYIAQKFMDDIIDLEEEKINKILTKLENDPEDPEIKATEINLWLKIKKKLLNGRRTGLSAIGLGDMLAMLGLPYGSAHARDLAEQIYKEFAISAYKSSIDMAKDRGAFSIWDYKKEAYNPFLKRIFENLSDDYWFRYQEFGRRNIAILTIPPSGTISLLAGISSGIEPVYTLSYKRRRKVNDDHPNKSFKDKNGDWWEEYSVLHKGFKDWMKTVVKFENLNTVTEEELQIHSEQSPYYNSTAYELNPIDRVKLQASIQKWIDHSISSTVNLPKTATEKDVEEIYFTAWKEGLKGITIYRDGCRDSVLFTEDSKVEEFKTHDAPKRPKELPCHIYTPTAHGQQYVVAIGLYEGKPYEVFAFKNVNNIKIEKEGYIKKVKRGRYDLYYKSKDLLIEDITSEMSQIEEDRTRLISASLRHGANIKFLVEQLSKTKGDDFQDFSKVIARVLKKYIEDEEKVTGATCENCGSDDLVYKEGCVECNSCGSSRCS